MTAEIIQFTGITKLDLEADAVLENLKGKLDGFVYAGYAADGSEVFGSTYADGRTNLWLMERLKAQLLATKPEMER